MKGRDDVPRSSSAWLAGDIDVAPFVSHRITLDEVNHGFELMEAQDGIRSVIDFVDRRARRAPALAVERLPGRRRPGGHGVFIDGNGVTEQLGGGRRRGITITHVLVTHGHGDHVVGVEQRPPRWGCRSLALAGAGRREAVGSGDLRIRPSTTPGHSTDHLASSSTRALFTADVLFKGTLGGTAGGGPDGSPTCAGRSTA